jgi:hypothetical protein
VVKRARILTQPERPRLTFEMRQLLRQLLDIRAREQLASRSELTDGDRALFTEDEAS